MENVPGSGKSTIAASNVTVVANTGHYFDVREDTTNAKWYFYIDGSSVCSSPITTTLPTVNLQMFSLLSTLTTAAEGQNFGWMESWSDK